MAAFVVIVAPVVAAEGPQASVVPAEATPGEPIELTVTVEAPELARATVDGEVRCTVTFPDGRQVHPCSQRTSLVEVQAMGQGERTYTFPYAAPEILGGYEVVFEADGLLRLPDGAQSATTGFSVHLPEARTPDEPTPQADGPGIPRADDTGGGEGDTAPPDQPADRSDDGASSQPGGPVELGLDASFDAARLMISTGLGTATVVTALVARRLPLGGRR